MPSIRPVLCLLLVALLVRGLPAAYALPDVVERGLETAAAAGTAGCPDHEEASGMPMPQHDSGTCRIACDLGMAPALTPLPQWSLDVAVAARIAAPQARLAAGVFAPDHPPPIS